MRERPARPAMNVNFKPAAVADLELLVGFMRALYAHDEIAFDEAVARRATVELLNDETKGRVWLIEADGEQAGYVVLTYGYSLEFHGRDALVDELFLLETMRGRGLGRRTLEFVAAFCRAQGISALHLEVEHTNLHAHRLYRNFGFREHERHFMTKWLNEE
jgi:diamine N-acetyltransferase